MICGACGRHIRRGASDQVYRHLKSEFAGHEAAWSKLGVRLVKDGDASNCSPKLASTLKRAKDSDDDKEERPIRRIKRRRICD